MINELIITDSIAQQYLSQLLHNVHDATENSHL